MPISYGQSSIADPISELNYKSQEGYCYGIANMAMQAILANDLIRFDERLILIGGLEKDKSRLILDQVQQKRVALINNIKQQFSNKKLSEGEKNALGSETEIIQKIAGLKRTLAALVMEGKVHPHDQEREFLRRKEMLLYNAFIQKKIDAAMLNFPIAEQIEAEIPAFFDGTNLYQSDVSYREVFDKNQAVMIQDCKFISPLVLSTALEKQGGFCEIDSFAGIYTARDLFVFFESLRNAIRNASPAIQQPIALVLKNPIHVITVAYDPINDTWIGVDANQLPSQAIQKSEDIAVWVLHAFVQLECSPILSKIYVNNALAQNASKVIAHWKQSSDWQQIHDVKTRSHWYDNNMGGWLHMETCSRNPEILKELLECGADPNQKILKDGSTALFYAVVYNSAPAVKTLLSKNADPNERGINNFSLLMHAASIGNQEIIQLLLNYGSEPNTTDSFGLTPLWYAVKSRQLSAVITLLQGNADPNLTTSPIGSNPLTQAIFQGDLDIVEALLACGANPNACLPDGRTPLIIATANGYTEIVRTLLDTGANAAYTMGDGTNALVIATNCCSKEIIELLLKSNVDPNHLINGKVSPLFIAAQYNLTELAKLLCRKGANPFLAFRADLSTLQSFAMENGVETALEDCLREKSIGADALYNITPREIAQVLGNTEIAAYLEKVENRFINPYTFFNKQSYCKQPIPNIDCAQHPKAIRI